MKKIIRKFAMPLAAFAIAMIFGAITSGFTLGFTDQSEEAQEVMLWRYTGSDESEQHLEDKYVLATGSESCPGGSITHCTLRAPIKANDRPDLDNATDITFRAP